MADLQQRGPKVARKRRKVWISAMLLSTVGHLLVMPALLQRLTERPEPQLELTYLDPDVPTEGPAQDGPTARRRPVCRPAIDRQVAGARKEAGDATRRESSRAGEKRSQSPRSRSRKNKPLDVAVLPHLKMVDQDQFPDEDDNKDARFLAQKNHSAAVDTQASAQP